MTFQSADLSYRGTICFRFSLCQDLVTGALPISLKMLISRCFFFRVSIQKVIQNTTTLTVYPILITCHKNLLLFFELHQFGHISVGNKTRKIITELSMATIYIFSVAMVTILMVFHLLSSFPPQSHPLRQWAGICCLY